MAILLEISNKTDQDHKTVDPGLVRQQPVRSF